MGRLSHIAVYPIKALDPVSCDEVSITAVGGLTGDRMYGIVGPEGNYVHGKRTRAVHRLDTSFDVEQNRVRIRTPGTDHRYEFDLDADREHLEQWLSDYFDLEIEIKARTGGAQTDSAVYTEAAETGPTIISAATLREVSSWFEGIDPTEMRLRLRPNLVVEDVPPFWEDRLIVDGGVRFRIGGTELRAVGSVPRCAVPARDPWTGEEYEQFRETFIRHRERTLPEWLDLEVLDGNLFSLMTVTHIPEQERDEVLRLDDTVKTVDTALRVD